MPAWSALASCVLECLRKFLFDALCDPAANPIAMFESPLTNPAAALKIIPIPARVRALSMSDVL